MIEADRKITEGIDDVGSKNVEIPEEARDDSLYGEDQYR